MRTASFYYTILFVFTSTFAFSQTKTNSKMNLKDLHAETKGVQTHLLFPENEGKIISLQILKDNTLEEHITKVPALLLCVQGNAIYEDERGNKISLSSGDYVNIEPNVKHWVKGVENSNLLLFK